MTPVINNLCPVVQALTNRISFLTSEETKIERDIENMRSKTRELLNRKAGEAQDSDILATAKDILDALQPLPLPKVLRVRTGKMSLTCALFVWCMCCCGLI